MHKFDLPADSLLGKPVLYMLKAPDVVTLKEKRINEGRAHRSGNEPREGTILPGLIVTQWTGGSNPNANLVVFLDGYETLWALSVPMFHEEPNSAGYGNGRWHYELDGQELTLDQVNALAGPNDVGAGESRVGEVVKTWEPDARGTWILAQ